MAFVLVGALQGVIGFAIAAAFLPAWCVVLGWRWTHMAVVANGDELMVRNVMWTHRLHRRDIRSFRIGGWKGQWPGVAIRAELNNGLTVVLWATGRYIGRPRAEVHQRHLGQLTAWLHARPDVVGDVGDRA